MLYFFLSKHSPFLKFFFFSFVLKYNVCNNGNFRTVYNDMFDSKQFHWSVYCHLGVGVGGGGVWCGTVCVSLWIGESETIHVHVQSFDGKIWVGTMNYGSPKSTPMHILTTYTAVNRYWDNNSMQLALIARVTDVVEN